MDIYTQYTYEKKWMKTTNKEALRMIKDEMPDTDVDATLLYILSEIKSGKVVTLGGCRFKG